MKSYVKAAIISLILLSIVTASSAAMNPVFSVRNRNDTGVIKIPLSEPQRFTLGLGAGWNLISIPLVPPNGSMAAVFGSISGSYDAIEYYNSTDAHDHWKSFFPGRTGTVNALKKVDVTMGLWLRLSKNATLVTNGSIPSSTKIILSPGWNLIGYPSIKNRTVNELFYGVPAYVKYTIHCFDRDEPYCLREMGRTGEVLRMGLGYWVYISQSWQLTVGWT
jgi:hypothetical protein